MSSRKRTLPTAYSLLPDRFADDRHGTILRGLARCGYRIVHGPGTPRDGRDLLVTWTVHHGAKEDAARAFEAAGGRVVVCEEAYFRTVNGERHFALALHDHNGAGRWPCGGAARWESFGIALKPWRANGHHIVVREQRGIGSARMASPPLWHDDVTRRLRMITDRQVVLRPHPRSRLYPAAERARLPLERALDGAHAVVTWSSSIAARALVFGVPVVFEAPHIVCAGACTRGIATIEAPATPDRLPALERLAWAQWSVAEIARGTAFEHLLA